MTTTYMMPLSCCSCDQPLNSEHGIFVRARGDEIVGLVCGDCFNSRRGLSDTDEHDACRDPAADYERSGGP